MDELSNPWASSGEQPPPAESATTAPSTTNDLWQKWESLSGKSSPKSSVVSKIDQIPDRISINSDGNNALQLSEIQHNPSSPVIPSNKLLDFDDFTQHRGRTGNSTIAIPAPLPSPPSKRPVDFEYDPERDALLSQVLELQDSLKDLVLRVETARNNHSQMIAENQILLKYINNLMSATGSDTPP